MSATLARRREVLQLAREHELLILEGLSIYLFLPTSGDETSKADSDIYTACVMRYRRPVLLPILWEGGAVSVLLCVGSTGRGQREGGGEGVAI